MKARDNPFRVARVLSAIRYEIPASKGDDSRDGCGASDHCGASDTSDAPDTSGASGAAHACGAAGAVALLPQLEALRYRAAIVGPHGSGKTTLLEDLESVLAARGFRIIHLRLDTDDPRLPREWRSRARWSARVLDAQDIVCLDGAEQLGAIAWLRFRWRARRAGGLIITTHGRGRLLRLPTLIECATSVGLLQRIMQRLAPDAPVAAPSAAELFTRHHGNIREALREMYDVYAADNVRAI